MQTICYSHFKIRRAKEIWGTREKSSLFPYKRTAFFSGTPIFFGPSYFEVALAIVKTESCNPESNIYTVKMAIHNGV